ncbi:MAG: hypothetical protein ABSA67_07495 [Candidatus Brocadiia bacterium]
MKTSCNIARPDFILQVEAIEPSNTGFLKNRPCRLILADGKAVERAICVEDHRGFSGKWWIHPECVARIEASRERMPANLASKLYVAGESGMGYQIFKVKMRDGTSYPFLTGNIVDFPDFPEGYSTDDVVEVYPHEGRYEFGLRRSRSFKWCFYVKE